VQSGQRKLHVLVGSIVSTGGMPQITALPLTAERTKDADVLIMLAILRGVKDRISRLSNNSFKKSPRLETKQALK
jgi:hypothetical protein